MAGRSATKSRELRPIPVTCLADQIYNDLAAETFHRLPLAGIHLAYPHFTRREVEGAVRQLEVSGRARITHGGNFLVRRFEYKVYPCRRCSVRIDVPSEPLGGP